MSSIQDLRFSLRSLLNQPLFSLTIIFTLAVGIGVNTAVFSMIDALVLRPYPDARDRAPGRGGLVSETKDSVTLASDCKHFLVESRETH